MIASLAGIKSIKLDTSNPEKQSASKAETHVWLACAITPAENQGIDIQINVQYGRYVYRSDRRETKLFEYNATMRRERTIRDRGRWDESL